MKILTGNVRPLTAESSVVRVLPQVARRNLGPFVFLDHFGPGEAGGQGMDVRPHPHIGLATVSVLFDGAVRHRDSLGSDQWIRPGAVNWMTAGRGIVHSERSEDHRGPIHGLQLWVALPDAHQDVAPHFAHHPADVLPVVEGPGFRVDVFVGRWGDAVSPVATYGPTHLAIVELDAGALLPIPTPPHEQELGVMVVEGAVRIGADLLQTDQLGVLDPADADQGAWYVAAEAHARIAVLGGQPVGPRTIVWNFVHSDPARIQQAKEDWRARRFPVVPGDSEEWIPLP